MRKIRLIALDLDGTLLTTEKVLTEENRKALLRCAEEGVEIVPATGRFYGGMPENIRSLPFVHYAITVNGAQVYDIARDEALYKGEIPVEEAVEIMSFLDTLPVIYDCYMDNWGWMTKGLYDLAPVYAPHKHSLQHLQTVLVGRIDRGSTTRPRSMRPTSTVWRCCRSSAPRCRS